MWQQTGVENGVRVEAMLSKRSRERPCCKHKQVTDHSHRSELPYWSVRLSYPKPPAQNLVDRSESPVTAETNPTRWPILSADESRAVDPRQGRRLLRARASLPLEGPYQSIMDLCWMGGFERDRVMTRLSPSELWTNWKVKSQTDGNQNFSLFHRLLQEWALFRRVNLQP